MQNVKPAGVCDGMEAIASDGNKRSANTNSVAQCDVHHRQPELAAP